MKTTTKELGFTMKNGTHFTGEEVLAYMEEMYDQCEMVERAYEDYKWNGYMDAEDLKEIRLAMIEEYLGV